MDISVDLPDPEDPMIATNSPGSITSLMPRKAWISTSPLTKVLLTSSSKMIGLCIFAVSAGAIF